MLFLFKLIYRFVFGLTVGGECGCPTQPPPAVMSWCSHPQIVRVIHQRSVVETRKLGMAWCRGPGVCLTPSGSSRMCFSAPRSGWDPRRCLVVLLPGVLLPVQTRLPLPPRTDPGFGQLSLSLDSS